MLMRRAANVTPLLAQYGTEKWVVVVGMSLFLAPFSLLRTTSHPFFRLSMLFGACFVCALLALRSSC